MLLELLVSVLCLTRLKPAEMGSTYITCTGTYLCETQKCQCPSPLLAIQSLVAATM